METGDHLITSRLGYTHHGLYMGDGQVIHYSGLGDGSSSGPVKVVSLTAFSQGYAVSVRNHPLRLHRGRAAVDRALKRLGEDRYNLLTNNCEHFVHHCIHGVGVSKQVLSVTSGVLTNAGRIGTGNVFGGIAGLGQVLLTQGIRAGAPVIKEIARIDVSPAVSIGVEGGLKVAAVVAASVIAGPVLLPLAAIGVLWSAISR